MCILSQDFQIEAMQNFIEETSVPIMAILDDNPENQQFVNHFLHSPGDKVHNFLKLCIAEQANLKIRNV